MKTSAKTFKKVRRKARIRSKISGTSVKPRLAVFRSLKYIYAQLIDDSSKKTLASASDLKIEKGTKTEKAKQVGEEIAKLASKLKLDSCAFDRNGNKYHGRIKALADAARENGLKF